MQLHIKGVEVQINDSQVANIVLSHFTGSQPIALRRLNIPRLGEIWPGEGGIYAGIMRGREGEPDYHLIVGPEIDTTTWEKAKAEAAALEIDGHKDFRLPFRAEQALQFANVPELFKKEWYWSCEQPAADSFCCARAVRRLIIQ